MNVNDIFLSIQGESTWQGIPCVFVRLTGCNLRCSYCDTQYAYEEGEQLSVQDIIERVNKHLCRTVEVTGGEPLLQPECFELTSKLADLGYRVLVETNGTIDLSALDSRVIKIMDIKCPSSGHAHEVLWENLEALAGTDEIKFVVSSREDYDWAKRKIFERDIARDHTVLMSPVFGVLDPDRLASWILEDGLNVRLNLQIHKYIWERDERSR